MTRRHRIPKTKPRKLDESYEDGDNWEFARQNFPKKTPPSTKQPQPPCSVETPPR